MQEDIPGKEVLVANYEASTVWYAVSKKEEGSR